MNSLKPMGRTIIAPCNPKDIRYHDGKYFVNYVLMSSGEAKPHTLSFKSYANAYLAMNSARLTQGFKALPPFKTYRG